MNVELNEMFSKRNMKLVKIIKDDDECKHPRKVEDEGTVFCMSCGMVFEDEFFFKKANHFIRDIDEPPKPVKFPQSVGDLKKMAKERGIKYYSRMSEEELCTVLETRIVKPLKVIFKNMETGEELGFKSLYKASVKMKVNPGLISYYINNKKEMKIGDTPYTIRKP